MTGSGAATAASERAQLSVGLEFHDARGTTHRATERGMHAARAARASERLASQHCDTGCSGDSNSKTSSNFHRWRLVRLALLTFRDKTYDFDVEQHDS